MKKCMLFCLNAGLSLHQQIDLQKSVIVTIQDNTDESSVEHR